MPVVYNRYIVYVHLIAERSDSLLVCTCVTMYSKATVSSYFIAFVFMQ